MFFKNWITFIRLFWWNSIWDNNIALPTRWKTMFFFCWVGWFKKKVHNPFRGISEFLIPKIEEIDIEEILFQQDGATCHIANVTIHLLRTVFENRMISRNYCVNWPPRSCDLTVLDYFLWGAVEDKCYAIYPETIEALKHEIIVVIHGIET